jgi:hypothetical protein
VTDKPCTIAAIVSGRQEWEEKTRWMKEDMVRQLMDLSDHELAVTFQLVRAEVDRRIATTGRPTAEGAGA